MRQSVKDAFFDYSALHEGFTPFMYCDTLNLVTTGIGNLIDAGPRNTDAVTHEAMQPALILPWKHRGSSWTSKNPTVSSDATQEEVAACWALVKRAGRSQAGGGAYAGLPGNNLTLSMDGLKALFVRTENAFNATLAKDYPGFETWPADAQLATMSMAWAMGPSFWPALRPNPKAAPGPGNVPFFQAFKDACDRLDFSTAAVRSEFKGGGDVNFSGNPSRGLHASRNFDNRLMFNNAAASMKAGADPDRLFFPGTGVSSSLIPVAVKQNASKAATVAAYATGVGAAAAVGWGLLEWWKGRK